MRILFTVQPGHGHLRPVLPLVRALVADGHDVRVGGAASFLAGSTDLAGVRVVPLGVDWEIYRAAEVFPRAERGLVGMLRDIFCDATALATRADVLALARVWRPELIIRETWEIGGAVAAAELGVPCVVFGIGRYANLEQLVDVGGEALREHLGPSLGWVGGDVYLNSCPTSLDVPGPRPAVVMDVVPVKPGTAAGHLVHVTLGTAMHRRPGVLRSVVAALAGVDMVVTTGPGTDPEDLAGPAVDAVAHRPIEDVLPSCRAVVCHAGWGTLVSALGHGLPVVCLPLGADGFTNAERCQTAGAGLTVSGPNEVRSALNTVLADPGFVDGARGVQRQIAGMPSPATVAKRLIQNLLS